MSDTMIEAKGLTKQYGDVTALSDVSFSVKRGDVVGFLGPNGAGKTTTMKILTCFIAPTEGTATVNGADVFDDPLAVRQAIGYLPESTPLYTDMLVHEYLEFMAQMRGLRGNTARQRIQKAVEATTLGGVLGKAIGELSKGFRQRVGIAQALVHEPAVLILDEPMSGLDPNQASEIRELIRNLGKDRTVILSTHNLDEVRRTCDRVLIISGGKLVADDTASQLEQRAGQRRYKCTLESKSSASLSEVRDAFTRIAGVRKVDEREGTSPNEWVIEITPSNADDLRANVFRCAVDNNLVMLGLTQTQDTLEDVFRHLTVGNGASA